MAHADFTSADIVPPGYYIKEELEARGWSQDDFAKILGRSPRNISELISGKRAVTAETARRIGEAFGTGAEIWISLEADFQLSKLAKSDGSVQRRARLYAAVPVKTLLKRGWIEDSDNIDIVEAQVLRFYGISSIHESPPLWPRIAARKSTPYSTTLDLNQCAWAMRVRQLATAVGAARFTEARFKICLQELRQLVAEPEEIRRIPEVLARGGIRFVVVEAIPGTKIDGAALWLDNHSPVVALSCRLDRVDNFWFTLLHELGHVAQKDGLEEHIPFDEDLLGTTADTSTKLPPFEILANEFASGFLIEPAELSDFVSRVSPLYHTQKIVNFAARIGTHPGIVVGELQHAGEIGWNHSRRFLVPVRNILLQAVMSDGWGHAPLI